MKRFTSVLFLMACLQGGVTLAQTSMTANASPSSLPTVQVRPLAEVTVQPEREAPAQVQARNTARVAAEAAGTVLRWSAEAGTSVRRGQVLVQVDPRDADLALQQAQAGLQAAQARLALAREQARRARDLVAQGFFSQEALAQRETEVALIEAELQSARTQEAVARRQKDKATVRSPFDGQVSERLVQVGESVSPGTPVYVLVESGADELQATLGASDAESLRSGGAPVFIANGQNHPVQLLRIAGVVQSPARTRAAWLSFEQGAPAPGTHGTLRWRDQRPHMPAALMVRRTDRLGVFVLDDQQIARFVPLPGAQEGRASPLPADFSARQGVVTQGQAALQDGMRVLTRSQPAATR